MLFDIGNQLSTIHFLVDGYFDGLLDPIGLRRFFPAPGWPEYLDFPDGNRLFEHVGHRYLVTAVR